MYNEMKKRLGQAKMVGMSNPGLGAGILIGKKKLATPKRPKPTKATRPLEQSMDMGVQKGLKNFRVR
jgi:hypothetical protein